MMFCSNQSPRRTRRLGFASSTLMPLMGVCVSMMATPPPAGVAPVLSPAGGLAIDGDLLARQPVASSGDWVVATNLAGTGDGILAPDGTPLDPSVTFHFVDPFDDRQQDLIFSGGSKWDGDPNQWGWTTGKPSAKTDINNVLFHVASDAAGHTVLAMSADRYSTQGESFIDFELLQSPLARTEAGGFLSMGPHGGRTTNDLVLTLAFNGGGKAADLLVWRWQADGLGGYHYVDITATLPAAGVFVALNTNVLPSPYPVFGSMQYQPNAFVEAAVDLTALIDGVEACENFGFVAMLVKTKASASDSAGIEDFLDPIAYDFRIGPLADAGVDQTLCSEPGGTPFLLGGTAEPGLAPIVSTQWRVVSGQATFADSNALTTTVHVLSENATLGLEVRQLNGCSAYDEVVLTAIPRPLLTISGSTNPCPGSVNEYSGTPGMESYLWSVSGNAAILGASNLATVTLRAGATCDAPFTLSLFASSNICALSTAEEILVQDTVPPLLMTGSNKVVECGMPWDFDPVSAYDGCSGTNVTVEIVSTVTNPVPDVILSATRTWSAADPCGNTSVASQTVTVVDTTPPVITCPGNITRDTDPGVCEATLSPGVATATDSCGEVEVAAVRSDGLPLSDPYPKGLTVITWTATDAVGLTNACLQTVTIVDTEPPVIECPPLLLVAELPRDSGSAPVEFESPAAFDNCSPPPVVVCSPPSGSIFPVGDTTVTCVVTDGSGNTNSCSFVVRVIPYRVTVVEVTDAGPGGLRDALLIANALPGETRIEFNIPGPGPHIIRPETTLPAVSGPVLIDGRTQPGFSGAPIIELDGIHSGGTWDGLVFQAASNAVHGLAVYGFDRGLRFETNAGHSVIQGNHLGIDGTGSNAVGNAGDGVLIQSANNRIGGSGPGEGNRIGGNGANGIRFRSEHARNNRVLGNAIGVGPDGITAVPNGDNGILLEVLASHNRIGTVAAHERNLIQFNGDAGIALNLDAGSGNTIGINVLEANGGLGIDLGDDGVTVNDSDDSDDGPNDLLNAPTLSDARSVDGITTVDGSLSSVSNRTYRLDFYLNDAPDPSGHGEGQSFLGFVLLPVGPSGTATFSVSFPVPAVFTQFVTATATDPDGNTSEFSAARQVRTPPVAGQGPSDTNAVAGSTITLCADASGSPPIFYQWRLNGANIPGETNQCITVPDVAAQDAGAYSVVVFNDLGGFGTQPAALLVPVTNSVPAEDDFADRRPLTGLSGLTKWSNRFATLEPGEPQHAGKPGGASVWYSLKLPPSGAQRGIFTIATRGSTFDTLLAVYEGNDLTNLTAVASDEDRGGFFTSGLRFNAIKGREYAIAVDGYFGEAGDFVLDWSFEETPHLLPVIVSQPQSLAVRSNGTAVFTVDASLVCGNGVTACPDPSEYPNGVLPGLDVQWYFDGLVISGATNDTLTLSNVQPSDLGGYWMEATAKYDGDGVSRTVRSDVADLQINLTGAGGFLPVLARDKFLDTLLSPPWILGGLVETEVPVSGNVLAAGGLTSGYTGSQIFNTVSSSSSSGETLLCGVPGGSSEWVSLVCESDGLLVVDTEGSDYDTVMAVYLVTSTSFQQVACNNDVSSVEIYSQLEVPVEQGTTNTILVDGVEGASGTLVLNCSLIGSATLRGLGFDDAGGFTLEVLGYPGMSLSIECSTDLNGWTPLVSTRSEDEVFRYTDPTGTPAPLKYYRAVLAP